jgi:hypothetical protein
VAEVMRVMAVVPVVVVPVLAAIATLLLPAVNVHGAPVQSCTPLIIC